MFRRRSVTATFVHCCHAKIFFDMITAIFFLDSIIVIRNGIVFLDSLNMIPIIFGVIGTSNGCRGFTWLYFDAVPCCFRWVVARTLAASTIAARQCPNS